MKEYSEEAKRVLKELSNYEIRRLRRENPFRNDRDNILRELIRRGVKITIISEISGMSETSVNRIRKGIPLYYKRAAGLQNSSENDAI